MSAPCTACGWFEPKTGLCTRVQTRRDGGVKVMRPDIGTCFYWKPIASTEASNDKNNNKE